MQTKLIDIYQQEPEGQEAERILRSCVHCGFCNATCPTYQVLGNELDGPRGRIYLIKQMLEGQPVSEATRVHLDRCLSCQSCETTCPSGVDYHHLLNIGRNLLEKKLPRPLGQRLKRYLLAKTLTRFRLFALLLNIGRAFRPVLPGFLAKRIPLAAKHSFAGRISEAGPDTEAGRTLFLHVGCVQDALAPGINQATQLVMSAAGYRLKPMPQSCCGALEFHLDYQAEARARMKRNIDHWEIQLKDFPDASILSNASGCGAFLKDYEKLLANDTPYLEKARILAAKIKDPVELLDSAPEVQRLQALLEESRVISEKQRVAFQSPCSLQHGQKLAGRVEALLSTLGLDVHVPGDAHLCCGSAGSYSILHPELAGELKQRKQQTLEALEPQHVLTANIGCQTHLGKLGDLTVKHWLELLAEMLTDARFGGTGL